MFEGKVLAHNMKLKLTRQPVTPLADASSAPERPGSLTWCYTPLASFNDDFRDYEPQVFATTVAM